MSDHQAFACDKCNGIDILGMAYSHTTVDINQELRCTQCQTGAWHDQFPKETYDPQIHIAINRHQPRSVTINGETVNVDVPDL